MSTRSRGVTGALLIALSATAPLVAQDPDDAARDQEVVRDSLLATYPETWDAASVPFGPGELLTYKVKVGIFNAGEATLHMEALDSVRGNPTYRAVMDIDASLLGIGVHDTYTTWFDQRTLQSWTYKRLHTGVYNATRHYEFDPDQGIWYREDNDELGPLGSSIPLDDTAFIYFVRQLPLEVGKSYTFSRYFKEDGNPVVIEVLRKDTRETEGVEYNTIVVRPLIQTDGMFGEGGEAELHFTDDERRLLVYLKSDLPNFPGSLTLHLRSVREGVPLNPEARALAQERWEAEARTGPTERR